MLELAVMDLFRVLVVLLSLGGCAAQDVLKPGPLYVMQGKNITFRTTVPPGMSFLTISWTFSGGDELVPVVGVAGPIETPAPGYEGRVSINHTNGEMTLGPMTPADSGDYAVALMDATASPHTGEVSVRVLVPVSKVQIQARPLEALEGNSTVVLNCSALGSFLTFSWTNRTAPLTADGKRITISNGELWSALSIAGVQREELNGPIHCSATNKLETEKSAPFNMTVYYGPSGVMMKVAPAVVGGVLRKGSNATLTCSSTSNPPATVSWFHNGVAVPAAAGPTLVLKGLNEKQAGKYHCSALNAKTKGVVASSPDSFTVQEAISGATVTGPKGALTAGDTSVNLTCAAAAGKVSRTAWLKDGKPLVPGPYMLLLNNGSQLSIKKLQKQDRGDYTCTLTNSVNSESATYKMVLFYGPDGVAISGETPVEVNDAVTLKCNADSHPPAIFVWRFNGSTVLPEKTAVLSIPTVAFKDAGSYNCLASNSKTNLTGTNTFQLSVKEEGALDEGLTGGEIAGIVIGVLAALLLAVGAFIYCKRRQTVESPY